MALTPHVLPWAAWAFHLHRYRPRAIAGGHEGQQGSCRERCQGRGRRALIAVCLRSPKSPVSSQGLSFPCEGWSSCCRYASAQQKMLLVANAVSTQSHKGQLFLLRPLPKGSGPRVLGSTSTVPSFSPYKQGASPACPDGTTIPASLRPRSWSCHPCGGSQPGTRMQLKGGLPQGQLRLRRRKAFA